MLSRLEALVASRDSRARTRSPSPRAWRPDFPGAARERVLSPDFPTMTREHLWAPPHHTHRHLTSLAPHERLPELPVIPREKPHTGAAARGNPCDPGIIPPSFVSPALAGRSSKATLW